MTTKELIKIYETAIELCDKNIDMIINNVGKNDTNRRNKFISRKTKLRR